MIISRREKIEIKIANKTIRSAHFIYNIHHVRVIDQRE